MSTTAFSTAHLDYFQRTSEPVVLSGKVPRTSAPPEFRRLWRVQSIGRVGKGSERQPDLSRETKAHFLSRDLLMAMYGHRHPVSFLANGTRNEVAIHIGTWWPNNSDRISVEAMDHRHQILKTALDSLYPAIEVTKIEKVELDHFVRSGFVLGVPTAKPTDPSDGALPLDRLIRALADATWACLVLAQPVEESEISRLRNNVISEIRSAEAAVAVERAPSPLAKYYSELLTAELKALSSGAEVGLWRTGVHLLGDLESYDRLASVWRGIFSGDESLPEPVRVWDWDGVPLAAQWALPDAEGKPGPGRYSHPLEYQTLLTSNQLAAYVHLPRLETSGFQIKSVPDFDVVPRSVQKKDTIILGKVIERTRRTETPYEIALDDLTRHAFVAGVTGSGKTNTIFYLLKQAAKAEVPFLVLEPAKAEYRALLDDGTLRGRLQVFTLGDEQTSPFRLNPFEVVSWEKKKTPVGVHIDLLRSVFTASFGMWTPLPQILERCLHEIYKDCGWDTTTNSNHRLKDDSDIEAAFPTLSDLHAKADEILSTLGYEGKIVDDMRAALLTRIDGLCVGGKGSMLNIQHSLPMGALLEHPTILELQGVGDDDDKAFLMGLLLIRLYEHRRASNEAKTLQHLMVIEEAHRLLTNVGMRGEEEANPRAKAVEAFANLLSEIRAYGQGVIIADQVPVKLSPEVIKNTNIKIAHRVVAADDRMALAGAMAMNDGQARSLATLTLGQAAVFSAGDDASDDVPVLIKVESAKGESKSSPPDDDRVRGEMSSTKILDPYRKLFQPLLPGVDMSDSANYLASAAAAVLVDDPSFRRDFGRFVLSITEDDGALDRLWDGLISRAQACQQRQNMNEEILLRALFTLAPRSFAKRRGGQQGWSYAETAELENSLREVLLVKLTGKAALRALKSFRSVMYRLHSRTFEPFRGCSRICMQDPPVCLYRLGVKDFIERSIDPLKVEWTQAINAEAADQRPQKVWHTTKRASVDLIEFHTAQIGAIKRIRLCYAQHRLSSMFAEDQDSVLEELLAQARSAGDED